MKNLIFKKLKRFGLGFFAVALPTSIITPSILLNEKISDTNDGNKIQSQLRIESHTNQVDTINEVFDKLVPYIKNQLPENSRADFLNKVNLEKEKLIEKYSKINVKQEFILINKDYSSSDLNNVRLTLNNLNSELDSLTIILGSVSAIFAAAAGIVGAFTLGIGAIPFGIASASIAGLAVAVGVANSSVKNAVNSLNFGNLSSAENSLNNLAKNLDSASSNLQNAMFLNWLVPDISKAKNIVDSAKPKVQTAINEIKKILH